MILSMLRTKRKDYQYDNVIKKYRKISDPSIVITKKEYKSLK